MRYDDHDLSTDAGRAALKEQVAAEQAEHRRSIEERQARIDCGELGVEWQAPARYLEEMPDASELVTKDFGGRPAVTVNIDSEPVTDRIIQGTQAQWDACIDSRIHRILNAFAIGLADEVVTDEIEMKREMLDRIRLATAPLQARISLLEAKLAGRAVEPTRTRHD